MEVKRYSWFIIVVLFLRILTPLLGQVPVTRVDAGDFDNVRNSPSVIKPRRGYIEVVPYFETKNELVSFHIATIGDPVTPFAGLPKIIEVSEEWPHADEGDKIFDITSWFPLKEMWVEGKEDKRWVYYNKTNGYIIANADQFLRASLYDYGMDVLESMFLKPSVSVTCVEVSDKVSLNPEAIFNSSHKLLWKSTSTMHSWGNGEVLKVNGSELKANTFIGGEKDSVGVDLELKLISSDSNADKIKTSMRLPLNEWVVNDCGISVNDRRMIMLVKAEVINLYGDTVDLKVDRTEFVIKEDFDRHDPFGIDDPFESTSFCLEYRIPVYMRDLFTKNHEAEAQYDSNEVEVGVDASGLLGLAKMADKKVIYYRSRSSLLIYGSEYEHDIVVERLSEKFGGVAAAKKARVYLYEIDALVNTKTTNLAEIEWKLEDVLAGNPDKLLSFGIITNHGEKVLMHNGVNQCEIWLTSGWDKRTRVYGLGYELKVPELKIEYKVDTESPLQIEEGMPLVVYMGANSGVLRCFIGVIV